MQTYIPKICSNSILTNMRSGCMIQTYKQMFATDVRCTVGGNVMMSTKAGAAGRRSAGRQMARNRAEVVRDEKIVLVSVVFLVAAILIGMMSFGAVRTQAASSEISRKYYTVVEVQSGDSLWSIASDYITDDYKDMNTYIEEVRNINKILGDDIRNGQSLTVPYYVKTVITAERE